MPAYKACLANIIYLLVVWMLHSSCENEMPSGYGNNYLIYVDENLTRHVLNFSVLPDEEILFGKVYFNLYTRNNSMDPEVLTIAPANQSMNSTYFNSLNEIKVISHGWMSDDRTVWLQTMKNSMLLKYDLNVITIDWSDLSKNLFYPWSALGTRYVGRALAKLLKACIDNYNIQYSSIHLIGHSLGAQVMGYAGMLLSGQVHRITGLDPARPLFEIPKVSIKYRLDESDAQFVDIIHTCAELFGYAFSYGHADFYPNGGKSPQPGCKGVTEIIDSCSHSRSYLYFTESIEYDKGEGFIAHPCESWEKFESGACKENQTVMGYLTDTNIRGDFYLITNNASKYAINKTG